MKYARRLLFSLVPVLLLLGGAELAARLLWEPPPVEADDDYLMPPHPTRLWAPRPGATMGAGEAAIRIGADGLRELPTTGEALRIFTVGDSNVFGHGLKDADTLQLQLKQALGRRGVGVDVLCGGVPGYSSEQSRALMDELGWDKDIDLLLIENLLSDSTHEHFTDRAWMQQLSRGSPRLDQRLLDASMFWAWLRHRMVERSRIQRRIKWIREPNLVAAERVSVREYKENLSYMMEEAARRGIGAAILQLATVGRYRGDPDAPAYVAAQRELAAKYQVPIVDAVQVLQASQLSSEQAFIDPVHASGPANGLYAEALAEVLTQAGWPENKLLAKVP